MRITLVLLTLMLATLLLSACSRPWTHPSYTTDKQIEANYASDSTDCTGQASDKEPLNKDRQNILFQQCMEKKGWTRSEPLNPFRE